MPMEHSKATIISMAVIASALATLLHEGVGHGVTRGCGEIFRRSLRATICHRCGLIVGLKLVERSSI